MARATLLLIDRGDLVAALDRAATRKVTIISAPAGSGKTSLLRAWAGRQDERCRLAVLQVQRDQQDAQQFWLALLDAVRHASATTGRAEPPAATPDFNAPAMVDRVLSELADACSGIHSLLSLTTLAVIYGYLMERKVAVRVLLVVASVPIAVAANSLRIVGTGLLVQYWDPEKAEGFFHEFQGWLVFVASLVMLYLLHRIVRIFWPEEGKTS